MIPSICITINSKNVGISYTNRYIRVPTLLTVWTHLEVDLVKRLNILKSNYVSPYYIKQLYSYRLGLIWESRDDTRTYLEKVML